MRRPLDVNLVCFQLCLSYPPQIPAVFRFQAFICIRTLAQVFQFPIVDLCMKGMFLKLVRNSKHFNRQNLTQISFLMNCVVVMWGEDTDAAYQQVGLCCLCSATEECFDV